MAVPLESKDKMAASIQCFYSGNSMPSCVRAQELCIFYGLSCFVTESGDAASVVLTRVPAQGTDWASLRLI